MTVNTRVPRIGEIVQLRWFNFSGHAITGVVVSPKEDLFYEATKVVSVLIWS